MQQRSSQHKRGETDKQTHQTDEDQRRKVSIHVPCEHQPDCTDETWCMWRSKLDVEVGTGAEISLMRVGLPTRNETVALKGPVTTRVEDPPPNLHRGTCYGSIYCCCTRDCCVAEST